MPPIVTLLFPISMLIVALIAVIATYVVWSGVDPKDFARIDSMPRVDHSTVPPAESASEEGVFSDIEGAFSDMRGDVRKAQEFKEADPMDHDAMFALLAEEIPEFREAQQAQKASKLAQTPPHPDDSIVEVLRVLRNRSDGSLLVEIEGKRYKGLGEITDRLTGRRFLVNVRDLAKFARLGRVEVPDLPLFELLPEDAPPASPPQTQRTQPPKEGFVETPSTVLGITDEDDDDFVPWEKLTIGQQIDRMLQSALQNHPEFAQRKLRIMQALDGGIRILVDDKEYRAVDDVPDQAVRAVIQEAIDMWEART